MKNNIISSFIWKFSERILAQVVSFIVSVILARMLLPESYGIVAMVMVFINIANVFVTSGFNSALIQKKDANETDFSTIFYCSLGVACFIYLILFIFAPQIAIFYKTKELTPILRVFGLKIIIASYNSIQHSYISRNMMFKKFFFSTLGGTIISGIIGILMAYHGFGVWALVAQYLINSVMDSIILTFTIEWKPKLVFSLDSAKGLMSYGWKVLCSSLIGTIYNNLRSLIIGRTYSSADLAYYNKGKNFPDLIINNVVVSITSVLFPTMSNANGDASIVRQLTRKSIRVTSYLVFPMMMGMAMVAKPFTVILLTEKWLGSVIFMQLCCLQCAFHTVSDTNLQAINAMGRSDIVLKLEFIKKPMGILLLILAIPHGIFMVVLTMPLTGLYTMMVNMLPNRKLLGYGFIEQIMDLMPAIIMSIIMGVCIYPISLLGLSNIMTLVVQITLGIIVYVVLSVISKNEAFLWIFERMRGLKSNKQQRVA